MRIAISLAQIDVKTTKTRENIQHAEPFIAEASKRNSQIVCLPELWTTGLSWDFIINNLQDHQECCKAICNLAEKYKIFIYGSIPFFNQGGSLVNAGLFINPQGKVQAQYNKTHLFSLLNEDKYFEKGKELTLILTSFATIGLSICYDLRFLELFRTYALKGANLMLLSAAFPYPRIEHWKILLRARAIENQFFVCAVNRIGKEITNDGKELFFFGNSTIIDPWGNIVLEASEDKEELLTAEIDLNYVNEVRKTIKVYEDRRTDLYDL